MNFYRENEEDFKMRNARMDSFLNSKFTKRQLECAHHWEILCMSTYEDVDGIVIRSTFNYELMYKVNQAKGIKK